MLTFDGCDQTILELGKATFQQQRQVCIFGVAQQRLTNVLKQQPRRANRHHTEQDVAQSGR